MAKNLKDMTRQEVHSYFKFKDYRGEQLKVVMAALDYGIDVSSLIPQGSCSALKNLLSAPLLLPR